MRLRRLFFPAAILIFFFLASPPQVGSHERPAQKPQPSAAQAQDREGIAALQKRDIAASMTLDVDALIDLWTDDGVLLPPHHEPIEGKAALRHFLEQYRNQYRNHDILAYNEEWKEVMVIGEYAYQWGTISSRMKPPTGAEIETAVHAVRILKREKDGYWRVARAIWNEAPTGK